MSDFLLFLCCVSLFQPPLLLHFLFINGQIQHSFLIAMSPCSSRKCFSAAVLVSSVCQCRSECVSLSTPSTTPSPSLTPTPTPFLTYFTSSTPLLLFLLLLLMLILLLLLLLMLLLSRGSGVKRFCSFLFRTSFTHLLIFLTLPSPTSLDTQLVDARGTQCTSSMRADAHSAFFFYAVVGLSVLPYVLRLLQVRVRVRVRVRPHCTAAAATAFPHHTHATTYSLAH